jgi:hypothetical protein
MSGFIPDSWLEIGMNNDELVRKIEELLKTEADLDFLLVLKKKDLEKLVACVRARLDQAGGDKRNRRSRE